MEEGQSEEEEERDDKRRRSMESKRASKGVRRHDIENVDEAGMQRDVDHLLFGSLSTLNKVCVECDLMGSNSSLPEDMDTIWGERYKWGCYTGQAAQEKG